jgi:cytochrome c peroxidase
LVVLAIGSAAALGGGLWMRWPHPAAPAPARVGPVVAEVGGGESIQSIPRPRRADARKVALGRRLFFETQLSADGSISCASCHPLDRGGADGRVVAIGVGGGVGSLNTPTVFNADLNPKQFWDGRADSLEAQISGPLESPLEMASSWPRTVAALRADSSYAAPFRALYPDGITADAVKDAIASFERTLVTPSSPFDRYLDGDAGALGPRELEGYRLFTSYGCVSCHQGRNVGGNLFEKMGIMGDYFAERGGPLAPSDLGRFNVTKRPEDRFKFRVPSLRLASQTAPYFHDGRAETLGRAIVLMGRYQLGEDIPPHDVDAIATFIGSLAAPLAEAEEPHAAR